MLIFCDYEKIRKLSLKDSKLVLHAFTQIINKKPVYYPGTHKTIDIAGTGYLLNPEAIISDTTTDILFKVQYILLALKRDYTFYRFYGVKYLPLSDYPDLHIEKVKLNPLIAVSDNNIYFKYEEY